MNRLATALVLMLSVPLCLEAAEPLPIIGVDEISPGQRGYGLSVFAGSEPQRFEVEVLGVMRNVSPDTNLILARLSGQGLEETGVIAGMSGSPVYVDGRLAGAVAFAWAFSQEAVAGVTPIEAMRELSSLPRSSSVAAGPAVELRQLVSGELPSDLLEQALKSLRPEVTSGGQDSLQWSLSGFGEQSQTLLRRTLGGVAPAGELAADRDPELVAGSAVAGVLVDGDFRLAATGTVTDRTGDEILAFGHSFLGLGPLRMPMAPAEVVTVVSSQLNSFKIANFGSPVGAFDQDRVNGMRGRLGLEAPMVPVTVSVAGLRQKEFHLRLADLPEFSPVLLAISALASLESASYASGPQGLDLLARFQLARHGELELRQSFDGNSAALESAIYLLAVSGYLLQNPLEQVTIEEIEVELSQSASPRTATLVAAHAERTLVRPGERVGLNLDLAAYRGEPFRHSLELEIPHDIPAGRYFLFVGDGLSIDVARLLIEPAAPVSFEQALRLLRSLHSRDELVVLGVFGGQGLVVAGEVLPRLPGSVMSLWKAASSLSATPLRLAVAQEQVEAMTTPLAGLVRIDLTVRRREPVRAKPAPGGEPETAAATAPEPPAESVSEKTLEEPK